MQAYALRQSTKDFPYFHNISSMYLNYCVNAFSDSSERFNKRKLRVKKGLKRVKKGLKDILLTPHWTGYLFVGVVKHTVSLSLHYIHTYKRYRACIKPVETGTLRKLWITINFQLSLSKNKILVLEWTIKQWNTSH